MGKMETKGIAAFVRFFHALFRDVETEGYCKNTGGGSTTCDTKHAKEVGMKTDFKYICRWSDSACSAKTIEEAIRTIDPNAAYDISGFSELHLFNSCSNFPHTFVGIAMGKFETKGLQFSAFQCSLTSFKVYANWPVMNQIAKRSLSLLTAPAASTNTHSVVNGNSSAAVILRKRTILGSSEMSKELEQKCGLFRVGGRGMEME